MQLESARQPIDQRRAAHERQLQELAVRWDRQVEQGAPAAERRATLEEMRARLLERNYINNLLATLQREMEQR